MYSTLRLINRTDEYGSADTHVHRARRSHAAADPRPARAGGGDGERDRGAVQHQPPSRVQALEGAGEGRADRAGKGPAAQAVADPGDGPETGGGLFGRL